MPKTKTFYQLLVARYLPPRSQVSSIFLTFVRATAIERQRHQNTANKATTNRRSQSKGNQKGKHLKSHRTVAANERARKQQAQQPTIHNNSKRSPTIYYMNIWSNKANKGVKRKRKQRQTIFSSKINIIAASSAYAFAYVILLYINYKNKKQTLFAVSLNFSCAFYQAFSAKTKQKPHIKKKNSCKFVRS